MTLDEAAKKAGIAESDARARLPKIHEALLKTRNARTAPPIDRNVYVDGNAMMAAAQIECGRALKRKDWEARGQEVLNELLTRGVESAKGGNRSVHLLEPRGKAYVARSTGLLNDEAALFYACALAYEASGDDGFASRASDSFERLNQNFWDGINGGNLDRMPGVNSEPAASVPWKIKPYMDTSEPSANGLVAQGCVRMYALTGRKEYHERAAATVEAFGASMVKLGVYCATLAAAGDALSGGVTLISIDRTAPEDPRGDALAAAAFAAYAPWKIVLQPKVKNAATQARIATGVSAWDALNIAGVGNELKTVTTPEELKKVIGN
jgi:hypothetical protein